MTITLVNSLRVERSLRSFYAHGGRELFNGGGREMKEEDGKGEGSVDGDGDEVKTRATV